MKTSTLIRTRIEHIRNAKLSRQQLEEKQVKKFRRLVAYANQHAPHYQDLIRDLGIDVKTCLPQDFPVL
ncbi:MAG: phenylacetate--CoA ligase [Proteobacteria bacterium]|nr:phenylacetate--CoA ligase [Pseudomonadota bacterium]